MILQKLLEIDKAYLICLRHEKYTPDFFIMIPFGCGKNNPVVNRQAFDLDFSKMYPGSGGSTYIKAFNVATVLVWKAEGKNFQYNGLAEKNLAYDNVSKTSFAPDYTYLNVTSTNIELPPGEYLLL